MDEPSPDCVGLPIPDGFYCPVLREVFSDPVVASDGITYERAALLRWFDACKTRGRGIGGNGLVSPVTNLNLESAVLRTNYALKSAIETFQSKRPVWIQERQDLDFAVSTLLEEKRRTEEEKQREKERAGNDLKELQSENRKLRETVAELHKRLGTIGALALEEKTGEDLQNFDSPNSGSSSTSGSNVTASGDPDWKRRRRDDVPGVDRRKELGKLFRKVAANLHRDQIQVAKDVCQAGFVDADPETTAEEVVWWAASAECQTDWFLLGFTRFADCDFQSRLQRRLGEALNTDAHCSDSFFFSVWRLAYYGHFSTGETLLPKLLARALEFGEFFKVDHLLQKCSSRILAAYSSCNFRSAMGRFWRDMRRMLNEGESLSEYDRQQLRWCLDFKQNMERDHSQRTAVTRSDSP